jgi:hypothetical protein
MSDTNDVGEMFAQYMFASEVVRKCLVEFFRRQPLANPADTTLLHMWLFANGVIWKLVPRDNRTDGEAHVLYRRGNDAYEFHGTWRDPKSGQQVYDWCQSVLDKSKEPK